MELKSYYRVFNWIMSCGGCIALQVYLMLLSKTPLMAAYKKYVIYVV